MPVISSVCPAISFYYCCSVGETAELQRNPVARICFIFSFFPLYRHPYHVLCALVCSLRLSRVEEERAAEGAELVDRRQDVKRLEQDLVDAHQVVEAGKTMLRAFQSGPVAKQFGKLVGRGAAMGADSAAQAGLEDDLMEGGVEDGGTEEGVPGSEGFSAADRLLGAVSEWSRVGLIEVLSSLHSRGPDTTLLAN